MKKNEPCKIEAMPGRRISHLSHHSHSTHSSHFPGPDLSLELALALRAARPEGAARVAGIDEAGRGPLAGPVVAAAVIWPAGGRIPRGLDDSKRVTPAWRAELFKVILEESDSASAGLATAVEIDRFNILEATRLAVRRALEDAPLAPGALLTDALALPGCRLPLEAVIKGDQKAVCIAAASIIAKVLRDRLMDFYASEFPGYSWESNRGYPTAQHYRAMDGLGPTTLHRLTFSGIGFFAETLAKSQMAQRILELAREKRRGAIEAFSIASLKDPPKTPQSSADFFTSPPPPRPLAAWAVPALLAWMRENPGAAEPIPGHLQFAFLPEIEQKTILE